ncbi:MAG TPA: cell division protein ZipA [Cycloclasticus sp.]|jgi:cell division protein ZipA|nr:cell division protein ZipA [Cycloclasticus sp.]HIL91936.1 cell division protein ZipA [Cycloclasticus sp.]
MEENSLRLILLGVGVTILFGIYFYDVLKKRLSRQEAKSDTFISDERIEPVMSTEASFSAMYEGVATSDDESTQPKSMSRKDDVVEPMPKQDEVPVAEQAMVIQLTVLPKEGGAISGTAILDAFTALDLEFGDMGIFHCYERDDGVEVKRFHVANILEPGIFPVGGMADFESTGVVLFFQTNDSVNPELAFESMLQTAKELSQRFDAILAGGNMKELTMGDISDIQSTLADLSRL